MIFGQPPVPGIASDVFAARGHRRGFAPSGKGAGQGERHDSPPTVQAGGAQPYSEHGGREAGPALTAMLAGRSAFGQNPMDASRGLQRSTK